ncbi:MAG: hypothetical protein FWG85_05420 [Bacteroidetes bacterium]|nr:hypothetical protein [Bacteroidota bacterium]
MKRKYLFYTLLSLLLLNNLIFAAFSGVTGTESDPYQISNKDDLLELHNYLITSYYDYANKCYILTNNIQDTLFEPIGNYSEGTRCFSGVFDGQGYSIILHMDTDIGIAGNIPVGLFRCFQNEVVIKNLTIYGYVKGAPADAMAATVLSNATNITFSNCINAATIIGYGSVGGFLSSVTAGNNLTVLAENCLNIGSIYNTYPTEIQNQDIINTGGIFGYIRFNLIMNKCINAGYIKAVAGNVGGITGSYSNSYLTYVELSNCINTGVVELSGNGSTGAIAGKMSGNFTITNCHYDKQFCNHKGVNGQDVSGVSPHLTRNMVGRKLASLLGDDDWTYTEGATLIECLYPQLKSLDHTDASKVGATPIFLYDGIKD